MEYINKFNFKEEEYKKQMNYLNNGQLARDLLSLQNNSKFNNDIRIKWIKEELRIRWKNNPTMFKKYNL